MPDEADESLSWHDRELIQALRRVAGAQSKVDQLEEQLAETNEPPAPDSDDVERLRSLHVERVELEAKAKSRFGGGAARQRVAEIDSEERLVLERLGFADAEEAFAAADAPRSEPAVDPAMLEFARRELADAMTAWQETQALEIPDAPAVDSEEQLTDDGPLASVSDLSERVRRPEAS